ncbi:Nucleobase-ascorbate transporter, partial [Thalictrum thalictroides]
MQQRFVIPSHANDEGLMLHDWTLPNQKEKHQGVGLLLDGIFGAAVGTIASVENVGLLGLTHIGSRRVVQISTAFMLFFSIFGKFGAFFASIPLSIFAAIYCVLLDSSVSERAMSLSFLLFLIITFIYHEGKYISATGISFVQFINFNSIRNLYILGLSLFLGISISQYFNGFNASADHFPINTPAGW